MIVPQNFQCLLGIQHSSPLEVVFVPFVVLGFNKMSTPKKNHGNPSYPPREIAGVPYDQGL